VLPAPPDWDFVALPSWLFGLHAVTRPIRLVRDALRARRGR